MLNELRELIGRPLYINSACRCPKYNLQVGGAALSCHRSVLGRPSTAFDIRLSEGIDKQELIRLAEKVGFNGIGVNYKTFVHVDKRSNKGRW